MSLESFQLNGKNAIVTGSHRGLGAAIAMALSKAGANVGCHGRDPKPGAACDEIRAAGRKTFYLSADLADSKAYPTLLERTIAEFGSIDILVNNAGVIQRAPAAEYPVGFWDELITVNLTAVFQLSQIVGRHMLGRGAGGKILNIASLLSFQGGILVPAYAAAKGGVAQLTKALANEWASKGINVNQDIWPRTILQRYEMIPFAAGRFWIEFQRHDGASQAMSRAPQFSCVPPQVTMSTDTSLLSMEAG
jgi:2-deoxy-D-gluconate 3-dehydrogenase